MKRILPFIALAAVTVLSVFSCQQEPEEIRVSSISLSKNTLELTVGDQASLDATISPDNATNKKISWSSSKESVATVTPDGIVEAVSAGTAFITATSEDSGVSAKCEITVKEKVISVTGIALNKTSLSLTEGEEFTLEATVTPDNATNKEISWASDNEAVVTVSSAGVVKALRAGTASITATTVDQGKTASCAVTVAEKMGAITGEATHISCRNAKLSGKVTLSQTTATNLSFGVLYSTSSGVLLGSATQLEAKEFDTDYNFTIDSGVLEPETTYYYRSYIIQNNEVEYGETKSFKTLALSSMIQTLDASGVNHKDATLNAMLDLTDCKYNNIEYGFELTPEGGQAKTLTANNLADKAFSYLDNSLVMNTGYSYVAYVRLDDILYKGETKTFTTTSILASATDLSSSASANCYIISEAGHYKFKTVKGNSTTSVGSVASASILWETFGTDTAPEPSDLISEICCKEGYIAFQTADTFKEGNAVIAAKDGSGNILWSWHIWFTDQPQSHVYNNNAGTMMDRNLGATSATPGDVGALGLLYQWGRKDPFLGSSSIDGFSPAKSTITWPSPVKSESSTGTIEYATAHPTTFITYNWENSDWYYTGDSSTDNTRWTTSDKGKSIYDPCPAGWSVPDGGDNGIWSKAGFGTTTYDSTNEGISFSISSPSTTWYPASGFRDYGAGGLNSVGNYGPYWSASPSSLNAYILYFNLSGYVDPSYYYYRADGFSVRCLQE